MTPAKSPAAGHAERLRACVGFVRAALVVTLMAGGAAPALAAGAISGTVTDAATASGLSPVTVIVPANTTETLTAYATAPGAGNSAVASAVYTTVAPSATKA